MRGASVNKAAIRQAALRLFAEQGYRGTTMGDIGEAVGIRGPSLYRHIKSKQDLLVDIIIGTMTELLSAQDRAIAMGGTYRRKVYRSVYEHVAYHCLHREESFVTHRQFRSLEPPHQDAALDMRRRFQLQLRDVVTQGRNSGEFNITNPKLITYGILAMGMGVSEWFSTDGQWNVDEISTYYARTALHMLTGVRPTGIATGPAAYTSLDR